MYVFPHTYKDNNFIVIFRLACQCMTIVLQLTESEKHDLINRYMDQKTSVDHLLAYNLKSHLSPQDFHKLYVSNQYITVEEVSLPIVGSPKQVCLYSYAYSIE